MRLEYNRPLIDMAEICPFRALHYNPDLIPDLSKVVTQPYDKISLEMQTRYYALSPYNLARIIRGRQSEQDSARDNVYTRASRDFHQWIETQVLISEREPSLYLYAQEYGLPSQPQMTKHRLGFVGLCRLEDYSRRIVHGHEETLSGPKADRLELLKVTRAHFGQIFMLYSDPEGAIERELAAYLRDKVWARVEDEYGSVHSVRCVSDPVRIERIVDSMRDRKLVIADGHHRYETALAYRDLCHSQGQHDERAEYVMATFVRAETDGLTILPTHRVIHGVRAFEWGKFGAAARQFFDWEGFPEAGSVDTWRKNLTEALTRAGREGPAIAGYAGPCRSALLRLRKDTDSSRLWADLPPSLRRLDVVVLHRLILEGVLGIDRQAVQKETNIRYVRGAEAALQEVDAGEAQICFLLNPTPVSAVLGNAFAGRVLPQKSTDFYPKLLSGLTIYWLDNPVGM